jgi:SAM-dependent methyltransferase
LDPASEAFYEDEHLASLPSETDSPRSSKALELMKRRKPGQVLDVGMGDGAMALRVVRATGCAMSCVDISRTAVVKARGLGLDAHRVDVSNEKLPFEDEKFDLVYCLETLEHLTNPDNAISEIRRVLKGGGALVLSTPNLASWLNRALLAMGVQPLHTEVSSRKIYGRPGSLVVGHLRVFTHRALKEFLGDFDFTVKIQGAPDYWIMRSSSGPRGIWKVVDLLDRFISMRSPLASELVAEAIKSETPFSSVGASQKKSTFRNRQ